MVTIGKCRIKGCERPLNKTKHCDYHQATKRTSNRKRCERLLSLGLCKYCGRVSNIPGLTACLSCSRRNTNGRAIYATKLNPHRNDIIVNRLKRYEPYLTRDWTTAEPWIRAHIELWIEPADTALMCSHSIELKALQQRFNLFLDGVPYMLGNSIRLGSLHDPYNESYT